MRGLCGLIERLTRKAAPARGGAAAASRSAERRDHQHRAPDKRAAAAERGKQRSPRSAARARVTGWRPIAPTPMISPCSSGRRGARSGCSATAASPPCRAPAAGHREQQDRDVARTANSTSPRAISPSPPSSNRSSPKRRVSGPISPPCITADSTPDIDKDIPDRARPPAELRDRPPGERGLHSGKGQDRQKEDHQQPGQYRPGQRVTRRRQPAARRPRAARRQALAQQKDDAEKRGERQPRGDQPRRLEIGGAPDRCRR